MSTESGTFIGDAPGARGVEETMEERMLYKPVAPFIRPYLAIDAETTLAKALSFFSDDTDILVVVERDGDEERFLGILTEYAILKSKVDWQTEKVKRLAQHAPKIKKSTSIAEAARRMVEQKLFHLPVVSEENEEELRGVVRATELIRAVAENGLGALPLTTFMSDELIVVTPDEKVSRALNLLKEEHISRVVVVRDGVFEGVLSLHDILERVIKPKDQLLEGWLKWSKRPFKDMYVGEVFDTSVPTAKKDTLLRTVLEDLLSAHALVVLDEKQMAVGIVTLRDILEHIPLQQVPGALHIHISAKEPLDRSALRREIDAFLATRELGAGTMAFYFAKEKERRKGVHQYLCRLRLRGEKKIVVVARGWGPDGALRQALKQLKQRLYRKALDRKPSYRKRLENNTLPEW